ncbi:G patch domain-containing protein 2 [Entomophthora muscae]|uniref:G patch domain-containing protein 2 n=1 Tax=Entomophthora muscae TaxID=34485 RepID=A0ACC2UEZ6_9FUNG|nr:G patch domain-containing protein 2 [Entomophthora muscae]
MAKKKHSKKHLTFQETLQILARNAGVRGSGVLVKLKARGKINPGVILKMPLFPNMTPNLMSQNLARLETLEILTSKMLHFQIKKAQSREMECPRLALFPPVVKNLQQEVKAKGYKQGGDRKKRRPEFNAPFNPNGGGIKYCYDSDIESVAMEPGCSKDHAVITEDNSEDESGETSDGIAEQEEGSDEHTDECENFHIDILGDPSQKPLPTEARQADDHTFISFGDTCDVNSIQARKSHHQEAMQDYLDNISVENLDVKLKEVHLSQDSVDSMSYGSLDDSDMHSLIGSEPSEEWAEGFKEGLQTALDLLPKFAKKILTNELKACVDKSLLPSSIAPKPRSKAKKTPQGFDKKPNEDRRHSTTVKGSSLQAANEAILDMLNNPHRKQVQFPLVSKPHRQSIIALSELYNLEIIIPHIKQHPLCVLKPDSAYSLPSAAEVNALIGTMPGSPMSKHYPQKKAKTAAIVCSSAPPIAASNIGHRLLSQMGWTPGQALGAAGDGILDPIQAEIRRKRQGLGS